MPLPPPFIYPPTPFRPVDPIGGRAGMQVGASLAAPTIRYVRKSGNNSNGGTSPADAWLTITKALQTIGSNTIVYVGPGVYRETAQATVNLTSMSWIVGDVLGVNTGDAPGPVFLTAATTDDRTTPGTRPLDLNSKAFLTFQNLILIPGSSFPQTVSLGTSFHDFQFIDCLFHPNYQGVYAVSGTLNAGIPANLLFRRCHFMALRADNSSGGLAEFTFNQGPAGDYDANIRYELCTFLGGSGSVGCCIKGINGTAGTSKGGGIYVTSCTCTNTQGFITTQSLISTAVPFLVRNCFIAGVGTLLNANTLGQIIESNNVLCSPGPRGNVAVGPGSQVTYTPLLQLNAELMLGGMLRPFFEPMASSPLNAFGAYDTSAGFADARGGPRPSAAARWAAGAYQRGNNFTQTTSVTQAGGSAITIVGDGFQDFEVPVDAGSVIFSVYLRYDANYTGPLPRLSVYSSQLGISAEVAADPTALGNYVQYNVPALFPATSGVVRFRIISGDTSGIGNVYADTFAVG